MKTVTVDLAERSYDIKIGAGILAQVGSYLKELEIGSKVLIITNPLVDSLYGAEVEESISAAGFEVSKAVIPDGEEYKSLSTAGDLYDHAVRANLDRTSSIVALGGGVVGDIAGFIAASFMRGINFIQVPTTLLAQVDSSVGGKVAVNHPHGKNLIGDFYQPKLVVADPEVLTTLDERELKSGLAEVIKYGIIWDQKFFKFLANYKQEILNLEPNPIIRAIKRSCEIKAAVVNQDEYEQGLRAILNYGHTIGHALEAVTEYQQYRHGEAVAVGMVAAAKLACKLDHLSSKAATKHQDIMSGFDLPISYQDSAIDEIVAKLKQDKKVQDGVVRFILAKKIGKVFITSEVPEETIREVLVELREE